MDLADRIKLRMDDLDLTQDALANRADMSQGMVYKLLARKSLNTSRIVQLADALECDVEWLATGQTKEEAAEYLSSRSLKVSELKRHIKTLPASTQKAIALEIMESLIDK